MAEITTNTVFEIFVEEAHDKLMENEVKQWVSIFEKLFRLQDVLMYNALTEFIYDGSDEKLDIFKENWSKIMERYNESENFDSKIADKFVKVEDHINLAITQRNFILRNIEKLNQNLESATQTVESLKEIKTRIYTEFVTILGIFTAVVLGAFGSLQLIGSVFTNIKEVPTGKLLVFSSLTSLGVVIMLFLLMQWINKIVHRDHSGAKYWDYSYKGNVVFYTGVIVMIYMLFIGTLLYGEEPKNTISFWLTNNWFGIGALIILTIALISLLIHNFKLLSKQNDENPNSK